MIIFKDISESLLQERIPGIMNVLQGISSSISSRGYDIIIRDTDRYFDSLEIDVQPQYSSNVKNDVACQESQEIRNEINAILRNTCCKCGCHNDITLYPYNKGDWWQTHVLCPICNERQLPKIRPIPPQALKDINGNSVKNGDILVCLTNEGRPFWGMILNKCSNWGDNFKGPNPKWGHFMLCHGYGNYPSSLAWAKEFIIAANCGEEHNIYDNVSQLERKYEIWLENHKDFDFDFYISKLKQ